MHHCPTRVFKASRCKVSSNIVCCTVPYREISNVFAFHFKLTPHVQPALINHSIQNSRRPAIVRVGVLQVVKHRMFSLDLIIPICTGYHAEPACPWAWLLALFASRSSKARHSPSSPSSASSLNMSTSIFRAFGQTTSSSSPHRSDTRKRMPIHRGTFSFVNRQSGTAMEMINEHSIVG